MDILKWCAQNDIREHFNAPFNFDGRTIACNGHMMIAIPAVPGYADIEESVISGIVNLLQPCEFDFAPLPIDITFPKTGRCAVCRGSKKSTVTKCEECNCQGTVEFENDHNNYNHTCKTCDGEGYETAAGVGGDCHACLGYGNNFERFVPIVIAGAKIDVKYARLLTSVENVEVCEFSNNLHFRSGDTLGVIMGLR